ETTQGQGQRLGGGPGRGGGGGGWGKRGRDPMRSPLPRQLYAPPLPQPAQPPDPMTPPSAMMHWPQTKAPALEARKTATPPMSSGWPMRLRADLFSAPARISGLSHRARAKSVWMRPGAMALMRILCLPHSMASDFTSDRSAALLML